MKIIIQALIFLLQNYHDHENKDLDKAMTISTYIIELKRLGGEYNE